MFRIALVLQDPLLFDTSVFDNVAAVRLLLQPHPTGPLSSLTYLAKSVSNNRINNMYHTIGGINISSYYI